MSAEVDAIILERWNAYLDNELSEAERAEVETAIAASEANAAFIEKQRGFNEALKQAFGEERRSMLSPEVRAKFQGFLKEEAGANEAPTNISLLGDEASNVIPMSVGRIAAAAVILIAVSVFGTLFATGAMTPTQNNGGEQPITANTSEVRDIDLVLASSLEFMDPDTYSEDADIQAAYAKPELAKLKAAKLEAYGCGMRPVSIKSAKLVDGTPYTQLCFCTCEKVSTYGPRKGKVNKDRFVVNVFKGNTLPKDADCDDGGCWIEHKKGYHAFGKYDKNSDTTFIVIMPSSIDDEEAEKIVQPILL